MFEKVLADRTDRRRLLQVRGVYASVAAHVLLVAGIVVVPSRPPARAVSADTATILLLTQAPPPEPPPPLPRPRTTARAHKSTFRTGAPRTAAPVREGERPRDAVEPLLRAPPTVAVEHTVSTPVLDLKLIRGLGDAGAVPDSGASHAGYASGGGAPVVDAEVLAEPPRMVNRREITAVLGRLYPYRFRWRGTQGQVVMMFIIGTDGRAEMETAQVLSATDPGFVEPTLKGLARMRFRPAQLDGVPVRVRATLPVTWVLADI